MYKLDIESGDAAPIRVVDMELVARMKKKFADPNKLTEHDFIGQMLTVRKAEDFILLRQMLETLPSFPVDIATGDPGSILLVPFIMPDSPPGIKICGELGSGKSYGQLYKFECATPSLDIPLDMNIEIIGDDDCKVYCEEKFEYDKVFWPYKRRSKKEINGKNIKLYIDYWEPFRRPFSIIVISAGIKPSIKVTCNRIMLSVNVRKAWLDMCEKIEIKSYNDVWELVVLDKGERYKCDSVKMLEL